MIRGEKQSLKYSCMILIGSRVVFVVVIKIFRAILEQQVAVQFLNHIIRLNKQQQHYCCFLKQELLFFTHFDLSIKTSLFTITKIESTGLHTHLVVFVFASGAKNNFYQQQQHYDRLVFFSIFIFEFYILLDFKIFTQEI